MCYVDNISNYRVVAACLGTNVSHGRKSRVHAFVHLGSTSGCISLIPLRHHPCVLRSDAPNRDSAYVKNVSPYPNCAKVPFFEPMSCTNVVLPGALSSVAFNVLVAWWRFATFMKNLQNM